MKHKFSFRSSGLGASARSTASREEGKALLSFAIAAPVFFGVLFAGWELGVRTATIPAVALNVSALIAAPQANSFYFGDTGIGYSLAGIESNLQRLANLAADAAQASGYPNAAGAVAYAYRCDLPIPQGNTNPEFISSYKTENGLTLDLPTLEADVKAACTQKIIDLPDSQCSSGHASSKLQLYVCYGVAVYIKLDPFSDPIPTVQVNIIAPGGPCPPPTPPPMGT